MAALTSCWLDPDAMSMSLSARPASVALGRSRVMATRPETVPVIVSSVVGRFCSRSLILAIDASESFALYPSDCITLG